MFPLSNVHVNSSQGANRLNDNTIPVALLQGNNTFNRYVKWTVHKSHCCNTVYTNNDVLYVSHDLRVWSVLKYNGVKKKGHRTQCPLQKGDLKKEKDKQQTVFTYCITQQGCYFNWTVEPQDLNYTTFLNKQKINKKNTFQQILSCSSL